MAKNAAIAAVTGGRRSGRRGEDRLPSGLSRKEVPAERFFGRLADNFRDSEQKLYCLFQDHAICLHNLLSHQYKNILLTF
jgi:hypothetical protein